LIIFSTGYYTQPKALCESLFKAFAIDICGTVEITEFISALAVLGGLDRILTLRFLFRVYDVNGTGEIERKKVERLLSLAYGEKLNVSGSSSRTRQQLDDIFRCCTNGNGTMTTVIVQEMGKVLAGGKTAASITTADHSSSSIGNTLSSPLSVLLHLRDFETYRGPLDVLGGWVLSVLSVFTEPLPARLLAIDRRYTNPNPPIKDTSTHATHPFLVLILIPLS
jgi:Ca2+-binding EF-hand superfamily protein